MMRRFLLAAGVSATAFIAVAGSASAQSVGEIDVGQEVQGRLNAEDAQIQSDEGDYRYEDFSVSVRAGQRLEAILRSADFDAYLEMRRGSEVLAFDDDGLGDATHARLLFTAPQSGNYVLRARTLAGLDGGAFSLAVNERSPAPPVPRPVAVRVGSDIEGAIAIGDPEADDGVRYDAYALRARAGERFAVSMISEAFDPLLRVGLMKGEAFEELAMNDDAATGGLNAGLNFTAPGSATYTIRATAIGSSGEGAYTLAVTDGPPPLAVAPIAMGASVNGELTETDGVGDGGLRADAYRFTAAAGQRIEVRLDSTAFDALVELFDASGASLDQDDDGGTEGTNARLLHTIETAGEYILHVRAIGDTLIGAYTLTLAEAAADPAPATLPFAEVVQGEIGDADPRDDEGRGFDAYGFSGAAGNRVQVVVRSGDFDTFVQVGRPGGEFEALGSDDDGLGEGTDSRLNYILPETGDYVLRASPLGSEEEGLYSIELTDRGPQPEPGSILIGATARGTLTDADSIADDGAYFDAYAVTVADGDKLRVTMVSNDFDSYLDVGREPDGGTFESVVSDDDGLSDTHARIEWTVEDAGAYVILARSFAQGQIGAYALTVERKP